MVAMSQPNACVIQFFEESSDEKSHGHTPILLITPKVDLGNPEALSKIRCFEGEEGTPTRKVKNNKALVVIQTTSFSPSIYGVFQKLLLCMKTPKWLKKPLSNMETPNWLKIESPIPLWSIFAKNSLNWLLLKPSTWSSTLNVHQCWNIEFMTHLQFF